jgi:maltose phosphorylase
VVEKGFNSHRQRSSESIFSIGNGRFGQRANFEEHYSGDTLSGSYVAGVYYPDKTRVGWWKNGYPEYFAKVLNSINWIGIRLRLNGEEVDLHQLTVNHFIRVLDMHKGTLERSFSATLNNGVVIHVNALRYCNIDDDETGFLNYTFRVESENPVEVELESVLDGNVRNEDANWDEQFWSPFAGAADHQESLIHAVTKKTNFHVAAATRSTVRFVHSEEALKTTASRLSDDNFTASQVWNFDLHPGIDVQLIKYVGLVSSLNYEPEGEEGVGSAAIRAAERAEKRGPEGLLADHAAAWMRIWETADILIEGDDEAQQGIRFNIFHLNQTYTGRDDRLNIGPKGFTGEKYGGSTYWDTEAYCIPFYLNTHDPRIARQLLVYRYNQLDKAIENAQKLGFTGGAALYPMVTMNGEECHNEWEITFEEIHRNGAIAYAIYNYVNHTGDEAYLAEYGFDVLLAIARFWAQRVNWSATRGEWVMLGVTGPNEYENNVNNNWYTNYIARWCLSYTIEVASFLQAVYPAEFEAKSAELTFDLQETEKWQDVIDKMALPQINEPPVFLQQDGFLDKTMLTVDDLDEEDRPINQKWSWDRILRSVFIKQADVLQGIYFFEDHFSEDTIAANFDFYEPKTVHESSLSPCVHAVLAARLNRMEKAYELYLRTARLDLDDYNHEAYQGLHITSMAGTWMAVVEGFGGLRVRSGTLHLNPKLPPRWKSYTFRVRFRGRELSVKTDQQGTTVHLLSGDPIEAMVHGVAQTFAD